jgi:hypothetical protein
MKTRTLGKSGLEVSAIGLGCMGLSYGYGPATDSAEMRSRLIRKAFEQRCHLLRHGRSLWAVHQRGPVGRSAGADARRGRDRHQVRVQGRGSARLARISRPERIRAVADAALQRLRTDGSICSISTGSITEVPIEDVAGTVKALIQRRKGHALSACRRPSVQSIRRAHAVQPVARAAERIFPLVAGARGGNPPDAGGTRHRLCPLQPAWQGLPYRGDQRDHDLRARRLPQHRSPVHAGGAQGQPGPCRPAGSRRRNERYAGADRSGVAAGAKPWIAPIPAPPSSTGWKRISAPPTSNSPPPTLPGHRRARFRERMTGRKANRYPSHLQARVGR